MIREIPGPVNPVHQEIQSCGMEWTLHREEPLNATELREIAGRMMTSISDACFDAGAKDVGHVKAWIKHANGFLYADTVGTPEDVTVEGREGAPVERIKVTVNAVICGLDGKTVQQTTEKAMETVFLQYGLIKIQAPNVETE